MLGLGRSGLDGAWFSGLGLALGGSLGRLCLRCGAIMAGWLIDGCEIRREGGAGINDLESGSGDVDWRGSGRYFNYLSFLLLMHEPVQLSGPVSCS